MTYINPEELSFIPVSLTLLFIIFTTFVGLLWAYHNWGVVKAINLDSKIDYDG